jgi:ubiquinone/menaquinone biosynthesis C-methylase UbiE
MAHDTLKLDGWVATLGGGAVDGFKVTVAGKELKRLHVELGLPSPDVKASLPMLDEADRCRFRIRAHLDRAELARARTSAVTCTPLAAGLEGRMFIKLMEPVIPLPSMEDIAAIGTGFDIALIAPAFVEVSAEFLGYFIQLAGLRRNAEVLDVGCGVGRMAYMLAHYLEPTARYEGFDIVPSLVGWARQEITTRAPHFKFHNANVYNKLYNQAGTSRASEFRFPFQDQRFDLAFLTSVFTHMLAPDVRHYLDELSRVLKPGGQCLTTCFLMNEESRALIAGGRSTHNLIHPLVECYTSRPDTPEEVIGYDEELLLGWIAERRFKLRGKYYGSWCGRTRFTSYQDMLVYEI